MDKIFPAERVTSHFPLMKPEEVAAHLGVNKQELRSLPVPYSMIGSTPRYSPIDVDQFQGTQNSLAWKIKREVVRGIEGDDGFVYFFASVPFVKVGYSRKPSVRLHSLRCASPHEIECLGTIRARQMTEHALHKLLKPYHHKREWYRLEDDLKAAIEEVCRV